MDTVRLEPLGARIDGLRLEAVDDDLAARLRTVLSDRGVVVLPGQTGGDRDFVGFLRRLGDLTFTAGETPVPGFPDLNLVSNVGRTAPPKSAFHVDTSYRRRPPAYTALRAVQVPSRGGATLFSDQYRAAATLPEELRRTVDGRSITHVVTGLDDTHGEETEADHPILRPHPVSGRTALYLSSAARCAGVSGLDESASRRTVALLLAHSTRADNILRHRWNPGDVVVWDNGCVMHRADHHGVLGNRVLHRGMVSSYRDLDKKGSPRSQRLAERGGEELG